MTSTAYGGLTLGPLTNRAPLPKEWDGMVPDAETMVLDPHGWARTMAHRHDVVKRTHVTWVLRHALTEELLKHPDMRQFGIEIMHLHGVDHGPLYDWWDEIILTSHGERHKRLRTPLVRSFSFPFIASMRPQIRAIVEDLVNKIGPGEIDFDAALSSELPVRTICAILGVPRTDIPVLLRWVETLSGAFGSLGQRDIGVINKAVVDLSGYVDSLILERTEYPRDDFLSQLIANLRETRAYRDRELTVQILGLLFAGSDTTRTALNVAVTLLLQHRDQWEMLVKDRSLIKGAVEESLRYEPTVAALPRVTTKEMVVAGMTLPENTVAVMNICAAQRDPARYDNPDQFDITRQNIARNAIGFGGGAHRCLGEALARAELEEALDLLADRFPQMEMVGAFPHFDALATGIRKLQGLTVRI